MTPPLHIDQSHVEDLTRYATVPMTIKITTTLEVHGRLTKSHAEDLITHPF